VGKYDSYVEDVLFGTFGERFRGNTGATIQAKRKAAILLRM